jgi:type II secretory pathway component PulC
LSFPAEAVIQPRSPKTKPDDKNWYRIIKEGDLFIVDEQTIASAVMRAREIMSNVKIRPYFADGKQCGMLVTKLTPIGILKDAGVVEGDIVTGVNGLKVNTPYQIFSAYRKIRNEQEIQVNITRDRKPLTLTYKVRKTI